jgi:hypothetical protein
VELILQIAPLFIFKISIISLLSQLSFQSLGSFMSREIHRWYSPNLNKDMEIVVYGHYGYELLMFPTAAADF